MNKGTYRRKGVSIVMSTKQQCKINRAIRWCQFQRNILYLLVCEDVMSTDLLEMFLCAFCKSVVTFRKISKSKMAVLHTFRYKPNSKIDTTASDWHVLLLINNYYTCQDISRIFWSNLNASSLKQHSTRRHVAPFGNIILIPSRLVSALIP